MQEHRTSTYMIDKAKEDGVYEDRTDHFCEP